MNEIVSVSNDLVKNTAKLQQKKFRDELNLFLLEGDKPIEEAYNSGIEIVCLCWYRLYSGRIIIWSFG